MSNLEELISNNFDGSTVEIMKILAMISEKTSLDELHYVKKLKTVSIKAVDTEGYKYSFERIEP